MGCVRLILRYLKKRFASPLPLSPATLIQAPGKCSRPIYEAECIMIWIYHDNCRNHWFMFISTFSWADLCSRIHWMGYCLTPLFPSLTCLPPLPCLSPFPPSPVPASSGLLPVSHLFPVKPCWQTQLLGARQVPPFWHRPSHIAEGETTGEQPLFTQVHLHYPFN